MDVTTLRRLIDTGETYTVEFKRARRRSDLSDDDIVEAVVCLANAEGGTILLGVEDSGRVTGTAPRHGDRTDAHLVAALILNRTDPPVAVSVEVVVLDGHEVVVIVVPSAAGPVGTKGGVFKRRSIRLDGRPECVPYRPHEMLSAGFSLTGRDYAETVLPGVTHADLDPREFDRFRRGCSASGDGLLAEAGNDEILRALRLASPAAGITLGAVLLFGRPAALTQWVPTAECLFQVLGPHGVTVNESLRLPLLAAAEALAERLNVRNVEEEVVVGLHRLGLPAFPGRMAREVVANALVHRDYAELGPTQVRVSDFELRVSSPGGFPPGVTLANLLTESRPRSPILADAFKRAGLVDRTGRGIPDIFAAVLRAGRPEPDYSLSTPHGVSFVAVTAGADLDFVRAVAAVEADRAAPLELHQLRLLSRLRLVGPSSSLDLAQGLALSDASLRQAVNRLVAAGLIEARGHGRSHRYRLSAQFCRAAADPTTPVHRIESDRPRQMALIVGYVHTHSRITRTQAAELCQVSPSLAAGLLRDLRLQGRLELRGEKRGSHYVLPSA